MDFPRNPWRLVATEHGVPAHTGNRSNARIRAQRFIPAGILMVTFIAGGCAQRTAPAAATTPDSGKLNSAAPSSVLRSETGATQVDPEEPKAGMNAARPDALKDVEPEKR
ncbi:MAG TPA: hypothetical protein VGC79_02315 [Polyangiaceae bacterium]